MPVLHHVLRLWNRTVGDHAPIWVLANEADAWFGTADLEGVPCLMLFMATANGAAATAGLLDQFARGAARLEKLGIPCIVVAKGKDDLPARSIPARPDRTLFDGDASVTAAMVALDSEGRGIQGVHAVLVDARHRIAWIERGVTDKDAISRAILAGERLVAEAAQAGNASMHAPVLLIPRLLDRAECARLVALHENGQPVEGTISRVIDGVSTNVLDTTMKRRADIYLEGSEAMRVEEQIIPRIQAEVARAFSFVITYYEYLQVGCYDSATLGFFKAHRDNENLQNSHWRFALSLNLNDDYAGGELSFPEFGRQSYRPAIGDGVVFGCGLLHAAAPVTRGRRFVLLSFLYGDDDAAACRARHGRCGRRLPWMPPPKGR